MGRAFNEAPERLFGRSQSASVGGEDRANLAVCLDRPFCLAASSETFRVKSMILVLS